MPTSLDVCSSALLVEWPDNQMLRSRALENDVSYIPLETLRGSRPLRGALPIRSCGVEGKKASGSGSVVRALRGDPWTASRRRHGEGSAGGRSAVPRGQFPRPSGRVRGARAPRGRDAAFSVGERGSPGSDQRSGIRASAWVICRRFVKLFLFPGKLGSRAGRLCMEPQVKRQGSGRLRIPIRQRRRDVRLRT